MHLTLRRLALTLSATLLGAVALFTFGCTTVPTGTTHTGGSSQVPVQVLQAGDVIRISFPGAVSMDTQQQIRRDGKINLNLVGEVQASGRTPAELETDLTGLYANQLVSKEVKVTVLSSSFSVFVSGAVLRPGKIQPDHILTVLEAVMEAGGFDYQKANTRGVVVIRTQGGKTQNFTLDLQTVLDGKPSEPFYLQSNDIVYVPEKFQWF